jgi:succinate-acetate transporter protein
MEQMQITSLDALTPPQKRSLYWGFLWRAFVMTLCSMLAGGLLGGVFGFVAGLVGAVLSADQVANDRLIRIMGGLLGFGCGLFAWWHYMRWLFNAKFGHYRLRLVSDPADAA